MLVHLVGSRFEISNNIEHLRQLVAVIEKEGHELVDNWVDKAYKSQELEGKPFESTDWSLLYKESIEALSRADAVIAETSTPSFSVGYQVAQAVAMKKPILVLNREGVEKSFFASGIEAGIDYQKYTPDTIDTILAKWLRDNDIDTKDMRFNFFINRSIYNYLRWTALKTGKTKAEILRNLVEREIDIKK
jgi:hypothetical protein